MACDAGWTAAQVFQIDSGGSTGRSTLPVGGAGGMADAEDLEIGGDGNERRDGTPDLGDLGVGGARHAGEHLLREELLDMLADANAGLGDPDAGVPAVT